MTKIERTGDKAKIKITSALATSAVIDVKDDGALMIHTPATWTSCDLTYYSEDPVTGDFLAIKDQSGNAATQTVGASEAREVPHACFAAHKIKIVSSNAANNDIYVGVTTKG